MPVVPSRTEGTPPRERSGTQDEQVWLEEMKRAYRDLEALAQRLSLPKAWIRRHARDDGQDFSTFAPRPFVDRMRVGDVHDPLLRQVLPMAVESERSVSGYGDDPVADQQFQVAPGVIQKYHGRALMIAAGACAVHCRYCFRRHFPYSEAPRSAELWQPALERLGEDSSLTELILSGGDPLTLRDATFAELLDRIDRTVPQLRRLRLHTRLPIVIPDRVTRQLVTTLAGRRTQVVVVLHANHAQELDASVAAAVGELRQAGVLLFNQAVLLRGVNDSADALVALSETLIDSGVAPYYLNQLDRVSGAAHFEVPVSEGLQLMQSLESRLPGYAVPRYVRDVPGSVSKQRLR